MVPPIRLWDAGVPNESALKIITRNSRMPDSLAADLDADAGPAVLETPGDLVGLHLFGAAAGDAEMRTRVHDGEWVRPRRRGYQMECCDCGHEAKVSAFRVPDDYPAMLKLIQQLARMNYDGEEINPGHDDIEEFDMSGDDASEALSGCIKEAREILGEK